MRLTVDYTKWDLKRNGEIMEELEDITCARHTQVNKDRTGEIMSTECIEEGSPNKSCSTRLGVENLQGIQQKDGSRP